jgi:hypothetical protein
METMYILLYGGDTCFNGKRLGLESLLRLRELLRFIYNNPQYRFKILLAAGSHPVHKEYPLLKKVLEERAMQFLYIMKKLKAITYLPTITLIEPDVWNTSNESLATAKFLNHIGQSNLFVVSSMAHKKRILKIWSYIGEFDITFIGATSEFYPETSKVHSGELYQLLYEKLAIVKVLLKDRPLLQKGEFSTFQAVKTLAID